MRMTPPSGSPPSAAIRPSVRTAATASGFNWVTLVPGVLPDVPTAPNGAFPVAGIGLTLTGKLCGSARPHELDRTRRV
jgi:hypothetical protein